MEATDKSKREQRALKRNRSRLTRVLRGYALDWQLYLLILPALIYLLIFSYGPMYGVLIAFKDFKPRLGIMGSPWVGLKYFKKFIDFPNFWLYIENTAAIGFYSLATFPCSVILALQINELTNMRFKKFVQMATYAPYFLSTVVVCSMIILFTGTDGIFNTIGSHLGFERVNFMTLPSAFDHIYVWSGVWQCLGWGTIIYLAALSGVSPELIEAARVDGASRLQIIWHVDLPAITPTIVIMLILSSGSVLSVGFSKIYLLQNSLNLSVSQVISTYVYQIGLKSAQYSYASAIDLFNTLLNIALLCTVNVIAKKVSDISIW